MAGNAAQTSREMPAKISFLRPVAVMAWATLGSSNAFVAHATDQYVDIVGENFDVAIRAHSDPLPDSTLVQRTLTPAPWFLFAGAAYVDANGPLDRPHDLAKHPSLFMMRTGVSPIWRVRRSGRRREEVVVHLRQRLL